MSFKQELATAALRDASTLTDLQKIDRIDTTISKTFAWVAGLLLISFSVAYALSVGFIQLPYSSVTVRGSRIASLGIIIWMGRSWHSMSYQKLASLLVLFAVLQGYGLTGIFYAYNLGSIYSVFLTTSAMFAVLSVIGFKTSIDVVKVGPILFAAMIALFIGMFANMYFQNPLGDIWISIFGLVIFSGFIIYDMNLIKQQALLDDDRIPVIMSLGLFINFINIFLFILQLMGGHD